MPAGTPYDVDASLQGQRARPGGYPYLPRKEPATGGNPIGCGCGIRSPTGPLVLIPLLIWRCKQTPAGRVTKIYIMEILGILIW